MNVTNLIQLPCPLFAGISMEDRAALVGCLEPRAVRCRKGQLLWQEGERTGSLGIVA